MRTVRTGSGAGVQIVCRYRRGSRKIGRIGSAHTDAEWEVLVAASRQRFAAGQDRTR